MRVEGSVTAISWIPSEAIEGLPKLPFELGVGHYDEPPPDRLEHGDLERLRDDDRFREANQLQAWIEVEDGAIVDAGYAGGGLVGSTTFRLGPKAIVISSLFPRGNFQSPRRTSTSWSSSSEKLRAWPNAFSATKGCIFRRPAASFALTPSASSA